MKTIIDYIAAAKARSGITSDRRLCIALEMANGVLMGYRRGWHSPTDEAMLRLANMAGIDATEALLDLNQWRAQTPKVKRAYAKIAQRLAGIFILGIALWDWTPGASIAATNREQVNSPVVGTTYYAILRWLRRRLRLRWLRFAPLGLVALLAACAPVIQPGDVGRLSCPEIEAGLGSLSLERNVIAGGSLAGATALALFVSPWAALPLFLMPSARGDRGEFALKVGEVVKGCSQGGEIKGSNPKDPELIAHPAW